jgi:LuxR family maltose regulon positive regulatory protein
MAGRAGVAGTGGERVVHDVVGSGVEGAVGAPVGRTIARARLDDVLARRHALRLLVLEAPAGFGRTTLLDSALASGPVRAGDRDLRYTCVDADADPHVLAVHLRTLVGPAAGTADPGLAGAAVGTGTGATDPPAAGTVADLAEALAGPDDPTRATGATALVVDDVHRAGPTGTRLLRGLLDVEPRLHLVASGRRVEGLGLARHLAEGTAVRLGPDDLAFTDDEGAELARAWATAPPADREVAAWPALASLTSRGEEDVILDYLREVVLDGVDDDVVDALAAVVAVGGGAVPTCDAAIAAAVGRPARALQEELARLPLVSGGPGGTWPHPLWQAALGGRLDGDRSRAVLVAAARERLDAGAIAPAGTLALGSGDPAAMADVLRSALRSQPPLVSREALRSWSASLPPAPPAPAPDPLAGHRPWLAGVLEATVTERSDVAVDLLESARLAFADLGDVDAEVGVMLHLGTWARRRDDLAALGALIGRSRELAGRGNLDAAALVALGEAVGAQLRGDHTAAVAALDAAPVHALRGDWAAQVRMVRGTNLALAGEGRAAVADLDAATGIGTGWSRAVAHDLLASVRWWVGDVGAALAAADEAVRLGEDHGAATQADLVRAARACMWAALDDPRAEAECTALTGRRLAVPEAAALAVAASALVAATEGDLERARAVLRTAAPRLPRAVRSSLWRLALEEALGLVPADEPEVAGPLAAARAAGRHGARHLASGEPAPGSCRPYLPARWCTPAPVTVELLLVGRAEARRDHRIVDHRSWARGRVRELALRLASGLGGGRARVAADLWPDHDDEGAGANLRVTLSHLLDVLDPDRARGRGSDLLLDQPGTMGLAPVVRVDLDDLRRHAESIATAVARQDPVAGLAAARRLVSVAGGPLLGGEAIGEWADGFRRALDDAVLRAVDQGGRLAIEAAELDLAEALGRLGVEVDPWSESAHRMVVVARLDAGDRDGARRAARALLDAVGELRVEPDPATVEAIRRTGLRHAGW